MTPTEERQKSLAHGQLAHALRCFTGTEHWYRHSLFRRFLYTDGVQYLAEQAGAYWLLDKIFANQHETAVRAEPFQSWTLTVAADQTALLVCTDGNSRIVHRETITYTDFPLENITLFLSDNTLLLPSEY